MALKSKAPRAAEAGATYTNTIAQDTMRQDFYEKVGGYEAYKKILGFVAKKLDAFPDNKFWQNMNLAVSACSATDNMVGAIKKVMAEDSLEPIDVLKKYLNEAEAKEAMEFLKSNKDSNFEFLRDMHKSLFDRKYMSEKQVQAVMKFVVNARKPKKDKTVKKEMNKKVELVLKNYFARENNIPITMGGTIINETELAVYFKGTGVVRDAVFCLRCGRPLTHPASLLVGYGPECSEKLGIPWGFNGTPTEEELKKFRKDLYENTKFEGWIPKSKIKELKEIV
jgi:hypothetical protein